MGAVVVETRYGRIRGEEEDGLAVFRGIPYAAPPVGPLRWRLPQSPAPWSGTREASSFGPVAPQPDPAPGTFVPGDPTESDEDCLTLNVWTPACDEARRPVLVFVHGGGFVTGSGAGVMYRGERLARRGVVVVTFNYRLGALGFLCHPELRSEGGFGNWGLWDQVAALEWVRDHAAAFGGDPERVTVFGESAGAMSVCDLLGAPRARGLFRRAIAESGAAVAANSSSAQRVAEELARELGLPVPERAALERVPVAELVAAQQAVGARLGGLSLAFQPVVDGGLLPRHPADDIAAGGPRGVDLLIGTNRDEFRFFTLSLPEVLAVGDGDLPAVVDRYLRAAGLGDRVASSELIAAYRTARAARGESTEPGDLFVAMASDWVFRVPALRLAEAHARHGNRVYSYLFTWESPFAGGMLGSCHALELPFVFGTLRHPVIGVFAGSGEEALALSDAIQAAWVSFARSGDPSAPELGRWPRYEPVRRATMVLGARREVVEAPGEEERRFWEERLGRYGVSGPAEGVVLNLSDVRAREGA